MSTLNVILKLETNLMYLFVIKSFNVVFCGIMIVLSFFLGIIKFWISFHEAFMTGDFD